MDTKKYTVHSPPLHTGIFQWDKVPSGHCIYMKCVEVPSGHWIHQCIKIPQYDNGPKVRQGTVCIKSVEVSSRPCIHQCVKTISIYWCAEVPSGHCIHQVCRSSLGALYARIVSKLPQSINVPNCFRTLYKVLKFPRGPAFISVIKLPQYINVTKLYIKRGKIRPLHHSVKITPTY